MWKLRHQTNHSHHPPLPFLIMHTLSQHTSYLSLFLSLYHTHTHAHIFTHLCGHGVIQGSPRCAQRGVKGWRLPSGARLCATPCMLQRRHRQACLPPWGGDDVPPKWISLLVMVLSWRFHGRGVDEAVLCFHHGALLMGPVSLLQRAWMCVWEWKSVYVCESLQACLCAFASPSLYKGVKMCECMCIVCVLSVCVRGCVVGPGQGQRAGR